MIWALIITSLLSNSPWEEVSNRDGIRIWKRQRAGVSVPEHRVETVIPAASARVWEVIKEVNNHPKFMPYMVEARILKEQGDVRWVYQRLSPPLISDRDYVVRAETLADASVGVYEQRFEVAAKGVGPGPVKGVVRVPLASGRWLLEPLSPQKTRVIYELLTDPGGMVPSWVVGFAQRNSFPDLFAAVTQRAKNPTWTK